MLPRGILAFFFATLGAAFSHAALLTESFDDVSSLSGDDWVVVNRSQATGTLDWFQGNPVQFKAFAGLPNSYVAANFECAADGPGDDTISNWLLSPVLELQNGDTLSFWTRSATLVGSAGFPDRLQVRLSTNAASTDVGGTPMSVGDFTNLLLDINNSYSTSTLYPHDWTQYSITLAGLPEPTEGRFAFRYFVEDGGPGGTRSNYIGIDSLDYTPVPEPATMLFLILAALSSKKLRRY